MEYLGSNDDLYNLLSNEESLISGKLKRINIGILEFVDDSEPYGTHVEVDIELLYSKKYRIIRIIFERASDYCFFSGGTMQSVYYIGEMKFFKTDNKWYISFDPYDQYSLVKDERDTDFILSEAISGYVVEKF